MGNENGSFAARVARWQLLLTNLRATEGLTHLLADQQQLEGLLGEARRLESQKRALRAQLRGTTARLREITARGDRLRSRLGAGLRWKFGYSSDHLLRFGFRPRPILRRQKAPAQGEQE